MASVRVPDVPMSIPRKTLIQIISCRYGLLMDVQAV
jgi:hypothetical protein